MAITTSNTAAIMILASLSAFVNCFWPSEELGVRVGTFGLALPACVCCWPVVIWERSCRASFHLLLLQLQLQFLDADADVLNVRRSFGQTIVDHGSDWAEWLI